jgi:hypothetical protein
VFRVGNSDKDPKNKDFQSWPWSDTGVVLVLYISKSGSPDRVRMIRSPDFWNPAPSESEKPMLGVTSDPDWFTLANVRWHKENILPRTILSNKSFDQLEKSNVTLGRLSQSKLEIAQTGVRNEWSDEYPPVGLFPDGANLDGG